MSFGKKLSVSLWTCADLTEDTGWKYAAKARPDRGLHDYERFLSFSQALSPDEEKRVENFIREFDNPGYCWWNFKHLGSNRYRLATTMDSSD